MDTLYGRTLAPDEFQPPFGEVAEELVQKGRSLHRLLSDHMKPQWKNRLLEFKLVDNPDLNAYAVDEGAQDCIYIFRGVLEWLYGTILGLLSTPRFLPGIGNIKVEVMPQNLPATGFPAVPLLRNISSAEEAVSVFFPKDQTRMTVAEVLVGVALEFLVYHEIGHILGGHLEILRDGSRLSTIAEFAQGVDDSYARVPRQVLECDADAFACHVTSSVQLRDEVVKMLCGLTNADKTRPKDFALLTYLVATGVLFRVLYPSAPVRIGEWNASYPHPSVRACLIAASTIARGVFEGSFTATPLEDIVADSVGSLEHVWAELYLPGQNPEPGAGWGQSVAESAMKLFEAYGNSKAVLDRYARIPRRWDNWRWPETKPAS